MYIKIRRNKAEKLNSNTANNEESYQNYLDNSEEVLSDNSKVTSKEKVDENECAYTNNSIIENGQCQNHEDSYCAYLDKTIFGPMVMKMNKENVIIKRNNKGLIAKFISFNEEKRPSNEIIKHNLQKVHFYEQSPECATLEDIFVSNYFID